MPNSRGNEESNEQIGQEGAQAQVAEALEEERPRRGADEERRDLDRELAQMEDRYKRALADLDNYRKRSARETERRIAESKEAQLREWLEAVDSVERALLMELDNPVFEGLRRVLEQMEAILARQGVRRIGAVGERFDPEHHEAVGVRYTDQEPDRTVVDVARSGYALGDRVLRPAEVIVSRAEQDRAESE
jgi:molecular chaperone GrpE